MKLYQFLQQAYNNSNLKDEIDFDEFIEGFMLGTFYTESTHEAFWHEDDFLGEYTMNYKVDHEKQEIELLFK